MPERQHGDEDLIRRVVRTEAKAVAAEAIGEERRNRRISSSAAYVIGGLALAIAFILLFDATDNISKNQADAKTQRKASIENLCLNENGQNRQIRGDLTGFIVRYVPPEQRRSKIADAEARYPIVSDCREAARLSVDEGKTYLPYPLSGMEKRRQDADRRATSGATATP